MQIKQIEKYNNKKCILFFNGWGMDYNAVKHLYNEYYDLYVFYDYYNFKSDFKFNVEKLSKYTDIYLIAWSLGVYVSSQIFNKTDITFTKIIAINGTEKPVNDNFGISKSIFEATINNLSQLGIEKFNKRVFGGKNLMTENKDKLSEIQINNKKEELIYLYNQITTDSDKNIDWEVALIANNDMIFNEKNQNNYWKDKCRITNIEAPHFIFHLFNNWQEIIDL